jgi:uncharacterized protein YjbJ (UPF0337 family)
MMNRDQVKGAANDAAGRAKRQVGEWTGDTNAKVAGAVQQIKGKTQKALGNLKEAAKDAKAEAEREQERQREDEWQREHAHSGQGQ